MLTAKQCDFLLKILNDQPFKGIDTAKEVAEISKELEEVKKQVGGE